jgi:hypothetical protein
MLLNPLTVARVFFDVNFLVKQLGYLLLKCSIYVLDVADLGLLFFQDSFGLDHAWFDVF